MSPRRRFSPTPPTPEDPGRGIPELPGDLPLAEAPRNPPSGAFVTSRNADIWDLSAPAEEADDLVKEMVVREVLEHARRETRAVELARPMTSVRGRPIALGVLAVLALTLAIHSWVARPEWVFGPNPARVSPGRQAAHLRFAMYLVARRVDGYRARHDGVAPPSLRETGERIGGVSYARMDSTTFELRARTGDSTIVYRSTHGAEAFLGASARFLREPTPSP